ncbi:MAG: fumarylacetoacetate hydrolase family protein [Hyphomicrobiales bacterium]|nr:fumarylacetoacetate hydrolase family protein [Hyphomicrobiales bacterium]
MTYVFDAPSVPALPIRGSDKLYPVHRIYCVGRNYADHAREMGHDPDREPPFFFQKNPDTIVQSGGDFPYPDKSENVHYEMELVVALGKGGKDISRNQALDHVFGYAAGLDMTRRDLQGAAKKTGRPWEIGKAFDFSAPCSEIVPAVNIGHPSKGRLWIEVNGEIRQDSNIDQLIWDIPETISYLSGLFTLSAGDLIYTGTPAGVGAIVRGDQIKGGVEGIGEIRISVT